MMMVMTGMAVDLHLTETLREDRVRCQIYLIAGGQELAENVRMRAKTRASISVAMVLCFSLGCAAQNQDRDRSGVPKTSATAPPPEQRVDINHASIEDLLKVPGMTQSWAARIVRYRPYRTKQDLFDKGVVGSAVYDRIKDFVIAQHDKP